MRRWVLGLVVIASCAACGQAETEPRSDADSPGDAATTLTSLSDRLPSTTPRDWVTYADQVAVVTVSSETRMPAPETDDRGEGDIDRTVRLSVDKVVWRAPDSRPLPDEFTYAALGWHRHSGESASEPSVLVADDRPRLEVGHRYVMALEWDPVDCDRGGSGSIPASWRGLGSGSTLPFDGGVLGAGEFAGSVVTAEQAIADADAPSLRGSVSARVAGEPLGTLRRLLMDTTPGRVDPGFRDHDKPRPCP